MVKLNLDIIGFHSATLCALPMWQEMFLSRKVYEIIIIIIIDGRETREKLWRKVGKSCGIMHDYTTLFVV